MSMLVKNSRCAQHEENCSQMHSRLQKGGIGVQHRTVKQVRVQLGALARKWLNTLLYIRYTLPSR